jgi:hypothetical protein
MNSPCMRSFGFLAFASKLTLSVFVFAWSFSIAHAQTFELFSAVDLGLPLSLENNKENQFTLRSAEVAIFGSIDHQFDGMLSVAAHSDAGETKFDVHEAYFQTSKLFSGARLRAGKFFLNIGRLNTFHQHDWPFIAAPKVHREFLSPGAHSAFQAEGASDTGLDFSYLLPTPKPIEFSLGITNGACFGHCHKQGKTPPHPLLFSRSTVFFETSSQSGLLLGASFMVRKDFSHTRTLLYGVDATFKKRSGKLLEFLFQNELFFQNQNFSNQSGVKNGSKLGFYTFPQVGFLESNHFGIRFDLFSDLKFKLSENDSNRRTLDYAFVPTYTFKQSEFFQSKLAYVHEIETLSGEKTREDKQIQAQFTFLLGAHPAHDF